MVERDQTSESTDEAVRCFTTRQVCEIVGVAPSTLNSWSRPSASGERLVIPSHLDSDGKRSDRYWSTQDLVTVRAINALRQAGCPMPKLRRAKKLIEAAWDGTLGNTVLYWDGSDIVAVDEWGRFYSTVTHPGQQMLHVVALPIAEWRDEAELLARPVDIESIKARRSRRPGKERRPERAAAIVVGRTTMTNLS